MSHACHRWLHTARLVLVAVLALASIVVGPVRSISAVAAATIVLSGSTLTITINEPVDTLHISVNGGGNLVVVSDTAGIDASDPGATGLGFTTTAAGVASTGGLGGVSLVQAAGTAGGTQTVLVQGGTFPALTIGPEVEAITFDTATTSIQCCGPDINATASGPIVVAANIQPACCGFIYLTSTGSSVTTTGSAVVSGGHTVVQAATGIGTSTAVPFRIDGDFCFFSFCSSNALDAQTATGSIFIKSNNALNVGTSAPIATHGVHVTSGNGSIQLVADNIGVSVSNPGATVSAPGDIALSAAGSGQIQLRGNSGVGTSSVESTGGAVTLTAGQDISLQRTGNPPKGADVRAATGLTMQAAGSITMQHPAVVQSAGSGAVNLIAGASVSLQGGTVANATGATTVRSTGTGPINITTGSADGNVFTLDAGQNTVSPNPTNIPPAPYLCLVQTNSQPININAGSIASAGLIDAGTARVTVKTGLNTRPMDLGPGGAGLFAFNDASADSVKAPILRVGDPAHTAALQSSQIFSPAQAADVDIVNGGAIAFNAVVQATRNLTVTSVLTQPITIVAPVFAPTGTVAISNAALLSIQAGGDIQASAGFQQTGPGPVQTAGDVTTTNAPISFTGPVTFTGSLALSSGSGPISFASTLNTGSGTVGFNSTQSVPLGTTTTLGGGTLNALNGVTVGSGRTLTGVGTINGPVTLQSGAQLSPGSSPGIVNTGNLTLTAGSTLNVEIAGAAAGTGYDQVNVTGGVNLTGATLNLTNTFSPAPAGSTFTIINNDGTDPVVGTFTGLAEGATVASGGTTFTISYRGGTNGNDVVLFTATAPPPATGLGNVRFIQPVRAVDTRGAPFAPIGFTASGAAVTAGQLPDGSVTRFKIAGQTFGTQSVPVTATGLLINVTLSQAQPTGGFVTVYPGDVATPPTASTVNSATSVAANFWAVGLPTTGQFAGTIAVNNIGSARDILIDLVGYYDPGTPSIGNLKFVSPVRVLDTRPDSGGPIGVTAINTPVTAGQLSPGQTQKYRLSGQTFGAGAAQVAFPADVTGILAHVTIIQNQASGGYTTLLPGDAVGVPGTSTVNPSTAVAFNAWAIGIPTTGLDAGTFGIYTTNQQHVIVDIVGFYAPSNPNTVGSLSLVPPQRVVDTRTAVEAGNAGAPIGFDENGNPIAAGVLAPGTSKHYLLNGKTFGALAVPTDARGGLINVTITQDVASGGFVSVYPGDAAPPNASTVNPATPIAASFWASGIPVAPAQFPGTLGVTSIAYPRHIIIDLLGYFR